MEAVLRGGSESEDLYSLLPSSVSFPGDTERQMSWGDATELSELRKAG